MWPPSLFNVPYGEGYHQIRALDTPLEFISHSVLCVVLEGAVTIGIANDGDRVKYGEDHVHYIVCLYRRNKSKLLVVKLSLCFAL
jgi:hypothetical protein